MDVAHLRGAKGSVSAEKMLVLTAHTRRTDFSSKRWCLLIPC